MTEELRAAIDETLRHIMLSKLHLDRQRAREDLAKCRGTIAGLYQTMAGLTGTSQTLDGRVQDERACEAELVFIVTTYDRAIALWPAPKLEGPPYATQRLAAAIVADADGTPDDDAEIEF